MKLVEMSNIMMKFENGYLVDERPKSGKIWFTVKQPRWNFEHYEYRISPILGNQADMARRHWKGEVTIEFRIKGNSIWELPMCEVTHLDFEQYEYRIRPALRPYTVDEARKQLLNKVVKSKKYIASGEVTRVTSIGLVYIQCTYDLDSGHTSSWSWSCGLEAIMKHYTFEDGQPCGILQ